MILADTGPLVALFDANDAAHQAVLQFVRVQSVPLWVPSPVIVEVAYFIHKRLGALSEAAFLRDVGDGAIRFEDAMDVDYLRAADLVEKYADLRLGAVDAVVIAIAERLNVDTIMTLDRRHFTVVRPAHCTAFRLVP